MHGYAARAVARVAVRSSCTGPTKDALPGNIVRPQLVRPFFTLLTNLPSSTFPMLASSARTSFRDDLECGRPGGSSALVARAQAATTSAAQLWDAMPDRHQVVAATFRVGAWVWGSVAYMMRSAAAVATTAAGAARPRIAEVWAITTSGRAEAVDVEVQPPEAAAWRSNDARYPSRHASRHASRPLSPSRSRSLSQCRDDETARRGMRPFFLGHRSCLDGVLHGDNQTEGKSHGHLSSSAYMASLLPVPPSSSPASRPSSIPPIPVVEALPFSSDPLFDPRTFDPRFPTAVPVVTPVAVPVSLEATMEMALGAMEVQVAVPI